MTGVPFVISIPFAIVKVGGSLLDWPELPDRLTDFLDERTGQPPRRPRCPDLRRRPVRKDGPPARPLHHLGDFAAHRLAIQAMDLASALLLCILPGADGLHDLTETGARLAARGYPAAGHKRGPRRTRGEPSQPPARPRGTVTSDSIAAWIAGTLEAPGRSCCSRVPTCPPSPRVRPPLGSSLVDPFFPLISSAVAQCRVPQPQRPVRLSSAPALTAATTSDADRVA